MSLFTPLWNYLTKPTIKNSVTFEEMSFHKTDIEFTESDKTTLKRIFEHTSEKIRKDPDSTYDAISTCCKNITDSQTLFSSSQDDKKIAQGIIVDDIKNITGEILGANPSGWRKSWEQICAVFDNLAELVTKSKTWTEVMEEARKNAKAAVQTKVLEKHAGKVLKEYGAKETDYNSTSSIRSRVIEKKSNNHSK